MGPAALGAVGRDVRVHRAGTQHRGADRRVSRPQLALQGRHQRDHAVLGHVVGTGGAAGHQSRDRRRRVDVPLLLLLDQRPEDLHAIDGAPQVDGEGPLPVIDRHLGDRAEDADAGVVAEHVHGAERVHRRLGQRLHVRQLGDVGGNADDVGPTPKLGHRGIERVLANIGEYHPHAGAGEGPGDAQPDPRRRSGDNRDFPGDVVHGALVLLDNANGGSRHGRY